MKKKQTNNPLVKRDADNLPYFVSPNRKTYRVFLAGGFESERVCGPRIENRNKYDYKNFRSGIAEEFGSTTGKLKKKHINRQRIKDEHETFDDIEQQKYEYFHGDK